MNPDQIAKLEELYAWMQTEKLLDTKKAKYAREGATTLTQVVLDSHGDASTVPAAYAGSVVVEINGRRREIPYIA